MNVRASVAGLLGICVGGACVDAGVDWPGDGGPRADASSAPGLRLLAPPADGEAPLNLAVVVVAADDPALEEALAGLAVVGPDGVAIEASPRWPAPGDPFCAGWPDGGCVVLDVAEPLAAASVYRVVMDGDPDPGSASLPFRTGDGYDLDPPRADLAVVSSDGCLVARATSHEPAWASLVAGEEHLVAPGGLGREHEVALPWTAAPGRVTPTLVLIDLAGNTGRIAGHELPVARATVVISEVLANPAGPEPRQEWLEIANLGGAPVDLLGLTIADETGADALPDVTLPAGARALVVPSSYDPTAPGDVAPADGTILARLDGSTIGSGLANAGETVKLLGTAGETLSVFTSYFDSAGSSWQGRSVERIRPGGCDVRANAAPNATGRATPGAPNSVE